MKKIPSWLRSNLEEVKGHVAVKGTFKERRKPKRYSGYATYMTKLIEAKTATYEKTAEHQVWKNAKLEE